MSRDYYFYKAEKPYSYDKFTLVERGKFLRGWRVTVPEFEITSNPVVRIRAVKLNEV